MNRNELIEKVAETAGLSKKDTDKILDTIIETIMKTVKNGDKVAIGGLGTFVVVEKKARTARNPKTGEAIQVAAKKAPKFKPGKEFKEFVN